MQGPGHRARPQRINDDDDAVGQGDRGQDQGQILALRKKPSINVTASRIYNVPVHCQCQC